MTAPVRRLELPTVDDLLRDATERVPMRAPDGLSDVPMERLVLDGRRCVVKWLSPEIDWIMRMSEDHDCRAVVMWEQGLYESVSPWVDPLVIGAGYDDQRQAWALLMRDATEEFLPEGAAPISAEAQATFVRDMAGLHAGMWGCADGPGLCAPEQYYGLFSLRSLEREARNGPLQGVPAYVGPGWERLAALEPGLIERVLAIADDPAVLVTALRQTPRTLVHHDWKGGNLGVRPDGRTVLVDWAFPSSSAGCADLAWYLAVNCDRLVISKEQMIADYREELERQGISTASWFDRQLELSLLGAFVLLGWSKDGNADELAWWVDRVTPVAEELTQ